MQGLGARFPPAKQFFVVEIAVNNNQIPTKSYEKEKLHEIAFELTGLSMEIGFQWNSHWKHPMG